ncbi:MAG: hypothetical protein NVV57_07315 [Demequina sp.]|nr:hypothetical protein [Demequina sp.]
MPQDSQQEPRGGLGCLWVVLLVSAPFVLLVAIAVFIQSDDAAWRLWALALLALALAAALGSVWVRRIAMRRASDRPADPAARLRKTFGSKRLQATVAAPNPVGGSLAPAYVSAPSSSDLTTVGGIAAGDGRIPRGLTVGWVQNGAELPRLDLYSASFDVELARAVSGELVPVQHGDLIDAWLVGADQAGALARLMGTLCSRPSTLTASGPSRSSLTGGASPRSPTTPTSWTR